MTNRITKTTLQDQVDLLNTKLNANDYPPYENYCLDLDYAECDGGYCLVSHNNSVHETQRMSGKELHQYMNGAIDWITGD
mgnify:CR=1 FL=1